MRLFKFCLIFLFLLPGPTAPCNAQPRGATAKGTLFIIGGGSISDSLRMQMLKAANWKKGDPVAVVTLASGAGDRAFHGANEAFGRLTGEYCIKFDSAAISDPLKLDSLRKAKIIYLGGGDQSRFMRLIKGTTVKEIITKAYQQGALVGGTSAGAAVMSRRMVTGHGLRDTAYASTFKIIQKGNLEIEEGLGLLDSVIIDQHFVVRSRHNRMLSAVLEFPGMQCIGIDESTAIIVQKGKARVAGESQVLVYSNPKGIHTGNDEALAARNIQLAIYLAGESFPIKK
ncbi:MAG TPA: cyanophycinase [Chitinophagaceae bacterium]|nr:cyanophycinase [Chitinophagaceae bacterium]